MKKLIIASMVTGCLLLLLTYYSIYAGIHGGTPIFTKLLPIIFGFLIIIGILAIAGIVEQGQYRWVSFAFIGLLIIVFSVLLWVSIGRYLMLIGLIISIFSLGKTILAMRNRNPIIALFILGCAMVIPFNGMTWWGLDISFGGLLFIGILAVAAVLAIIGINTRGRERWLAFALTATLLLGFSLGYLYSLGFILAPFALAFLIISIMRLAQSPG